MFFFFFFVRQKTAYAMRISDWSSDVCSSDLKDPTFGLDAVWIAPGDADAATGQGYLVVDPGTVIATHLNHKLAQHSAELLGPDEVQSLLDGLKERAEHLDRKSVVSGKSVSVRVDLGGCRIIKKTKTNQKQRLTESMKIISI